MKRMLASIGFAGLAIAAVASQSSADTQTLPLTVELTKSLGFCVRPGTDNAIPFVIAANKYLDVGSRVKLTSAVTAANAPSTLWTPNTFCAAEFQGSTGYIRCDDPSAMKPVAATTAAQPSTSSGSFTPWPATNAHGVSCGGSLEPCKKFCEKACDPGGVNCTRLGPGDGMIDIAQTKVLPKFKHIATSGGSCKKLDGKTTGVCKPNWAPCTTSSDCAARATQDVIDGLTKLDAILDKDYPGYSIDITSCWRDGINEAKAQCYSIGHGNDPGAGNWMRPGASPHSNGKACDMYLQGKQETMHAKDEDDNNKCDGYSGATIKSASAKMDEIMTKAGAWRLKYEPWHYEWNNTHSCRCQAPECNDKYWPPACDRSQCNK